jgi:hypothetical protein
MKRSYGLAVLAVLLSIPVALVVVMVTRSNPSASARARSSAGSSVLASQIDQFSVNIASKSGDANPTQVSWVSTTLGAASSDIAGGGFGNQAASDIPVYALEISGQFHLPLSSADGTDLYLFVNQSTWTLLGYGVQDSLPSMQTLGSVQTDPLSGVSPTSMQVWRQKYHVSGHSRCAHYPCVIVAHPSN